MSREKNISASQPMFPSDKLRSWLLEPDRIARELKELGTYDPIVLSIDVTMQCQSTESAFVAYDKRWGEWSDIDDYEDFEVPHNIVYGLNEDAMRHSLGFSSAPELIHSLMNKYRAWFLQNIPDGYEPVNRIFSKLSAFFLSVYHDVLDKIGKYGHAKVNDTLRVSLTQLYIRKLFEHLERLSVDRTDRELSLIAPIILECVKNLLEGCANNLDDGFVADFHERVEKIEDMFKIESVKPEGASMPDVDSGWLFFSSQRMVEMSYPGTIVCSHERGFPIGDYYNDNATMGFLLVPGAVLQAFPENFCSNPSEIALGRDWTFEKGVELQTPRLEQLSRQWGTPVEELIESAREYYGRMEGLSLRQAYELRKPKIIDDSMLGFTEIWVEEATPYMLWIDEEINYSQHEFEEDRILDFLNSRPDLPIVNRKGVLMKRSEVLSLLRSNPFARDVFKE